MAFFWKIWIKANTKRNPPIIAKIGTLVTKNVAGSARLEANSLRLPFWVVLGDIVKLMDCREPKNSSISELLPEALAWKRINWQNSILKYVVVISPNTMGPTLVPM